MLLPSITVFFSPITAKTCLLPGEILHLVCQRKNSLRSSWWWILWVTTTLPPCCVHLSFQSYYRPLSYRFGLKLWERLRKAENIRLSSPFQLPPLTPHWLVGTQKSPRWAAARKSGQRASQMSAWQRGKWLAAKKRNVTFKYHTLGRLAENY